MGRGKHIYQHPKPARSPPATKDKSAKISLRFGDLCKNQPPDSDMWSGAGTLSVYPCTSKYCKTPLVPSPVPPSQDVRTLGIPWMVVPMLSKAAIWPWRASKNACTDRTVRGPATSVEGWPGGWRPSQIGQRLSGAQKEVLFLWLG